MKIAIRVALAFSLIMVLTGCVLVIGSVKGSIDSKVSDNDRTIQTKRF